MTNQKPKELSDKVDFQEPNAQNVSTNDYILELAQIEQVAGLCVPCTLESLSTLQFCKIVALTDDAIIFRRGHEIFEQHYQHAIIAKKDGRLLLGRNVRRYYPPNYENYRDKVIELYNPGAKGEVYK